VGWVGEVAVMLMRAADAAAPAPRSLAGSMGNVRCTCAWVEPAFRARCTFH
jgi:hypothetical protein